MDEDRSHRYYGYGLGFGVIGSLAALYFVGSDVVNYIHSPQLASYAANPQNRAVVNVASCALEIFAGLTAGHFVGNFFYKIGEKINRRQMMRENPFNSALSPDAIKKMRERSDAKKK